MHMMMCNGGEKKIKQFRSCHPAPNPAGHNTWGPRDSQRSTYFERRRGGGTDPGQAAAAAAAWVWLCAWWDSLAPACFGSLGGAGSQSPVSQSGLISQMQGIHSLCKARRGMGRGRGSKEGGKKREKERERGTEWNKAVWLHGFYLSLHISDIPPHSLGWSWQRIGRGWCAHRVCSDSSLNGIVTSHNACARVRERESDRECKRERERGRNRTDERVD